MQFIAFQIERARRKEIAECTISNYYKASKFYKKYWNLKQLHNLNMVYEEIKDDIGYFLRLYKLVKDKSMGVEQVVDLLAIATNDLPSIEERFKRLRNDVSMLQSQKYTYERNLYRLNNQIATTSRLLNSFHISCGKERREIENLQNEKAKLKSMVTEFKSNNEEYFKIKEVAQESMKDVLTNGKLLLQFATASVIESLRRNPELCNFVLNDVPNNNHTTPYGSSGLSLMLPREQQSSSYIDDDIYSALILESEKLYNKLTRKLTNEVSVASTVDVSASSLPSLSNNNNQRLIHKIDNIHQTKESTYD